MKPQEFPMEEARIFLFINIINKQAMTKGGRIYKVLGNHDLLNLNGETKNKLSSYVSTYAKTYPGYIGGRLDYFKAKNYGSKLIGEDGVFLFLMINEFIFVHGGISSNLISKENIIKLNTNLNEYIKGNNNFFDMASKSIENQLSFESEEEDGLVQDRFFGFKQGKSEQELCSVLYNKFKRLCSDRNFCDPDKLKLVIGHCVQNKTTEDKDKIFQSSFSQLNSSSEKDSLVYAEEFIAPVYKGDDKDKAIYGITVSCGDRKNGVIDYNNPSIFRIDVGMSRGFNPKIYSDEHTKSRTPQVLKIDKDKKISIIKSTLKNTLIHVTDMDEYPYYKKYNKYKNKYVQLKNLLAKK